MSYFKTLAFLVGTLLSVCSHSAINRNEPNKAYSDTVNLALQDAGVPATCTSKKTDYYRAEKRHGVFTVQQPSLEVTCKSYTPPVISWEALTVNGTTAVNYRVIVSLENSSELPMEIAVLVTTTPIYLPRLTGYTILIEGYDLLGNSVFTSAYTLHN